MSIYPLADFTNPRDVETFARHLEQQLEIISRREAGTLVVALSRCYVLETALRVLMKKTGKSISATELISVLEHASDGKDSENLERQKHWARVLTSEA